MTNMNNFSQKIVLILLPCVVCVFLMYGFLVRQTILNVVNRENVGKENSRMLSSISSLEAQYMTAKANVNLEVAYAQGFKNADAPTFITRSGLGKADLSYRIQ